MSRIFERRIRPPYDGSVALPPTERPAARPGVSDAAERYLEAIFYIEGEGEAVRAARLADWLGVSPPTIAAGIGRLVRDGLIRLGPGRTLELTKAGRAHAAGIVRRHRIAERWLTDVLGFDWLRADVEASRLEHAMSAEVADRLHELIGRPATCPHGNTIPGTDAKRGPEQELGRLAPGRSARLRRISEVAEREAPELLRFLADSGFTLGGRIQMVEASPGAGTVTVRVGGRRVSMSTEVARKIWVDAA